MDINQTSFRRQKSGRLATATARPEAKSTSDTAKLSKTSANSPVSPDSRMAWKEGQIIKGEVIDLRYNEVTISLEPDKQAMTAKLEGSIGLAIGQKAQFQVTEESNERITLKLLSDDTKAQTDTTIEKALLASSLPLTDRNKALVLELLNHRMPIDKRSLQFMVKLSIQNREASPLTLVWLQKHQIPVTPGNIRQFETYYKGTNSMINELHTLTKHLTNQMQQPDSSAKELILYNEKLLNMITKPFGNGQDRAIATIPQVAITTKDNLPMISPTAEQSTKGIATLPPQLNSDLIEQITNGTLALKEAANIIGNLYHINDEIILKQLSTLEINKNPETVRELYKLFDQFSLLQNSDDELLSVPVNGALLQDTTYQNLNMELQQILKPTDRASLYEILQGFSGASDKEAGIRTGTATLDDILSFIKEALPNQEEEAVKQLLGSSLYSSLLEEVFHQRWTITPEMLSKKPSVSALYQTLQEDAVKINDIINDLRDSLKQDELQEAGKNVKDHISFLKDLNEMFTYLQLPVQLKNQDIHGDLYVFTKKDAMSQKKDNLSVLLHLDLMYLGPINIHILMNHNQIQAKFCPEDILAGRLLSEHLSTLTKNLQKKGYQLHATVEAAYEKPDFHRTLTDPNSQENYPIRYNFDIRT